MMMMIMTMMTVLMTIMLVLVTCRHQACVTSFLHLRSREAHLGRICPLLWRRVMIIIIYDIDEACADSAGEYTETT